MTRFEESRAWDVIRRGLLGGIFALNTLVALGFLVFLVLLVVVVVAFAEAEVVRAVRLGRAPADMSGLEPLPAVSCDAILAVAGGRAALAS